MYGHLEMINEQLVVSHTNIRNTRVVVDTDTSNPQKPLQLVNEVLIRVQRFAITSNNITYCVMGENFNYFDFFPSSTGFSSPPVWGIGIVESSTLDSIPIGMEVFGFFPAAMYTRIPVCSADVFETGFHASRPHLKGDMGVYNQYMFTNRDPLYPGDLMADYMLVYRPLFITSFMVADCLQESNLFGAHNVIVTSASSKTGFCLAFLLKRSGVRVTGLTSKGNMAFVKNLGIYDSVFDYDNIDLLPIIPTAIADVAGNISLTRNIVNRLGFSNMKKCLLVGVSHWDASEPADVTATQIPQMEVFFAPVWIKQRQQQLGRGELNRMLVDGYHAAMECCASGNWTTLLFGHGIHSAKVTFDQLLTGKMNPRESSIVVLDEDSFTSKL